MMERYAEVMTHWPRQKDCAGHFDGLCYVLRHSNRDGWNTLLLDGTLNQSDGLMANRSSRSQQGNVRPLFIAHGESDVRDDRLLESIRIHVISDETEKVRSQTADETFRD